MDNVFSFALSETSIARQQYTRLLCLLVTHLALHPQLDNSVYVSFIVYIYMRKWVYVSIIILLLEKSVRLIENAANYVKSLCSIPVNKNDCKQ